MRKTKPLQNWADNVFLKKKKGGGGRGWRGNRNGKIKGELVTLDGHIFSSWRHKATTFAMLKDPRQPPPFSMPSKSLILHGEVKSYCFTCKLCS